MTTDTQSKLPDKPSELIRVALEDLEKCEADPRYRIDMDVWHQPNSHCSVCFAGAVMAKRLDAIPTMYLGPIDFDGDEGKLNALDSFRMGWLKDGIRTCGRAVPTKLRKDRRITPYHTDPAAFKRDMRALADLLESHNL